VWFTGLDAEQLSALQSSYPAFVDGANRSQDISVDEVECRACQLAVAPGLPATALTRKGHQAGAGMLSDDIKLVLPGAGGYKAHAVPFTGEFGRTLAHPGGRAAYPVAALVLLDRGEQLCTEPVKPSAALARLLAACPFVNIDAAASGPLFDALSGWMARVPVIGLACRRDEGFETIMKLVTDGIAHARANG